MKKQLFKSLLISLGILFFTACGEAEKATEVPTQNNTILELDVTAKSSLQSTTDDIRAKLEAQNFSASSATPSSGYKAAANNSETYSMADVIFTIGSDDLNDATGNTMEQNGAYYWFKANVADAGKLTPEELEEFNAASIEDFNTAFVESYYAEAQKTVGDQANPAALLYAPVSSAAAYGLNRGPQRIFGFFFKMFNPMTYMGFMINMVKAVMTFALAQMFKMMLMSGTMTKLMLRLSIRFPILTTIMIHVLGQYWGITSRMVPYLKYDREFGELFMQLAYEQPKMAHFVFQNIDAPLYNAMTYSMLLSQETTERLAIMMHWYATSYLVIPSQANRYDAFTSLLFDTRENVVINSDTNMSGHGDGSELANERFYYAMFKYPLSTEQFIKAMQKVDAVSDADMNGLTGHDTVVAFMDFIFLGTQNTDIYPTHTGINADQMQGTYNIFAIAQGMLAGIEQFGFEAYLQNFIDFAMLMPPERYLDYGQAFGMAGYTYYAQSIYTGEGEPTMMDFLGALMGALPALLESCEDQEKVATFQQMLGAVQPYIDEFMNNGMPNMSMPNVADSNATVIIDGDVNQTITAPLKQDAKVIPAPTSLIDIINNFPVLWEKNYSDEGYKDSRISNDPFGYSWSMMSETLADLNWMQIPYPNNFQYSSYFDFTFTKGTVDMYVVVKQNDVTFLPTAKYALTEVTEMSAQATNQYNQGVSFKVFKTTITPDTDLYVYDLIRFSSGIAFDLSGAVDVETLPVGEVPVDPVVIDPVVEPTPEPPVQEEVPDIVVIGATPNDDPIEDTPVVTPDPEPEVVIEPDPEPDPEPTPEPEPTVMTLSNVIVDFPTSWEKDYTNSGYLNRPVLNGYADESWTQMPAEISDLNWMEIPKQQYFSYYDNLEFKHTQGTLEIYFVSKEDDKAWLEQLMNLSTGTLQSVTLSSSIHSSDTWNYTFYVYKMQVQPGESLEHMNSIKNNISGIAFNLANITN